MKTNVGSRRHGRSLKIRRPRQGVGRAKHIGNKSSFALATAGPPLSLTLADSKRGQDFKRGFARTSIQINENQCFSININEHQ